MSFIWITLLINTLCNVLAAVYSYIVLYTDWAKAHQIQPKIRSTGIFWQRLPLILLNLTLLSGLTAVGLYAGRNFFVIDQLPTVWVFVGQLLFILFCDDFYFYFYHRLMHENKFLLSKIHYLHHRAYQPFPLEYIYVHPLEWMGGYIGPFVAILLLQQTNIYVLWAYVILRNLHEIDIHSGIKSVLMNKVPLIAPTEHHDLHHARLQGNYASMFKIWDWVFGTVMKKQP
ncbi:MAG: sterol desaturase family protein [Sphingobacteriales bacterium]|nr:sterol desaturase family protein [Sphingobacteriales bacterium]MCC7224061.1 sterol desaturase family protein [Chitinophagales bacterium]